MTYAELVAMLKTIEGAPFAEYEWRTRPAGNFGTVQIDFEAPSDDGDGLKLDRAMQGSVDLYTHGVHPELAEAVETILTEVCGSCWERNSQQYEHETGLLHREWVFELEGAEEA